MHNLRYYERIWREHFGANNKKKVTYWQDKADEWLKENIEPVEPKPHTKREDATNNTNQNNSEDAKV